MTNMEKMNLENAANTPIIRNLKDLLITLTVKDLRHIGNLFFINNLGNKPKKELVNIVYGALTSEKKLSEVMERFIDIEFKLLKELINNNGIIQDNNISIESYNFLYMLGLVFLFKRGNKFYISMTDDVYNVVKEMNLSSFEHLIDDNTKSYNLLKSMVELYGVVPFDDFVNTYCLYYGVDFMEVPIKSLYFCERYDNIAIFDDANDSYFINSILNSSKFEDILFDILNRQLQINRKQISLNDILKYSDYDYYEDNLSRNNFKQYLKLNGILYEDINLIMLNIVNMYKLGHSFIDIAIPMLEDYGVEINEHNINEILEYLTDIYNNTRLWCNNGWTPVEMRQNYK